MSPEQAQGREDVDQRVDVWSFCIVLYECLVGRPPFFGNYESTLNEILEKPIVPITDLGISEPALSTHSRERSREATRSSAGKTCAR